MTVIRTGVFGNERTREDHPNFVIEIGQCTKKIPGDLSRHVVTQAKEKNNKHNYDRRNKIAGLDYVDISIT